MEELAKMGVNGWPAVVAFTVMVGGIVCFFQGWPTFITINRTNCKCKCNKKRNENSED
jgi:hypothetical protein